MSKAGITEMNSSGSLLKPLADSLMGDSSLWKFGNQMGHQPCIWVLCCTICNCIVIGLMDFKGFKGSLKFGCSFVNKPGFGCDTLKLKWFFFSAIYNNKHFASEFSRNRLCISRNKEWTRLHTFKFNTFH